MKTISQFKNVIFASLFHVHTIVVGFYKLLVVQLYQTT